MTKGKPTNIAASVRQRLLNIAREKKEDFQLVLIRYALERFLYRLSKSTFRDTFILKGAMLFQIWSNESHRPTRDVDFLSSGEPSEKRMENTFVQILNQSVPDDGLRFDKDSILVEAIKEDQRYRGIRVRLNAYLDSARIPVQVDVGFGDAVIPDPIEIDYPVILDFETPHLKAYSKETVVAEKFQAMVVLGIANSRMKDFFDLWILSRRFGFDGRVLQQAMTATFARRETEMPSDRPTCLTSEFAIDGQKQKQWDAFLRKAKLESGGQRFVEILDSLSQFLMPPATASAAGLKFGRRWSAGGPWR